MNPKGGVMKKLVLVIVAVLLAGCHGQVRTGSICVEPFSTAGFKTSNPIDIKQDIVDALRDQIPPYFEPSIEKYTKLKAVSDCKTADYTISGKINTVDTEMTGHGLNIFTGGPTSSGRTFGLGVQGTIVDNKTSKIISTFDMYQHESTLEKTMFTMFRDITHDINYVKK